jgi:hypothetical protein
MGPMRVIFLLMLLAAQSPEPWLGTWKLNLSKSTAARDPRYKRGTTKIEPWQDGLKVTYDLVGIRGGVTHMEWTGKFDGKDYAIEGVDYVLTNAYSRIDGHTYQITIKTDGVLTATARVVISSDGKTLTTSTTGNNAQGKSVTTTTIYERE